MAYSTEPTVIPAVEHNPDIVELHTPFPILVGALTVPETARNKPVIVPAIGIFPPVEL